MTMTVSRQMNTMGKPTANTCMYYAGLGDSVECASNWKPGGRGFNPRRGRNILSRILIMKYFLLLFSPFR